MSALGTLTRAAPPGVVAAIGAAWTLAVVGEVTGLGDRLHHDELATAGLPLVAALVLFLLAWQVHVAAMMLPSSLPLIALFDRVSATQPHRRAVRAAFLSGYAVVWLAFGAAAFLGDAVLHGVVDRWAWLAQRPWPISGNVLVLAGAFQFSSLKDRCLRECRHPAAFVTRHYRRSMRGAFALGNRHGLFCLGCCWALMIVLVAVGVTNLAWMAPLTLLMVLERTSRVGDRLVAPAGVALIALGSLVLVTGVVR